MDAKHTASPWELQADPDYRVNGREVFNLVTARIPNGEFKDICHIYGGNPHERNANARLIAAAPELLEALSDLLFVIDVSTTWTQWEEAQRAAFTAATKKAEAAILKAQGR